MAEAVDFIPVTRIRNRNNAALSPTHTTYIYGGTIVHDLHVRTDREDEFACRFVLKR